MIKIIAKKKPKISFNPITEEFEIFNKGIQGDPEWINNITDIFEGSPIKIIKNYVNNLQENKPDLEINEEEIEKNIEKLRNITNYPFSVLELSPDLDPEDVSEIFVRINSKGKPLNQSDFILTLMSVYWDEGRKALENFTKQCKKTKHWRKISI